LTSARYDFSAKKEDKIALTFGENGEKRWNLKKCTWFVLTNSENMVYLKYECLYRMRKMRRGTILFFAYFFM